jgi:mycothiol synthase
MALPLTDEPMVDTAGLPAGVAMRPFAGDEDVRVFVEIANAGNREDGVHELVTLEGMRNWVGYPSRTFDAAQDVAVVTVDDRPIAYGWTTWVDSSDGVRDYSTRGHVHPAWRRRGIGTAILRRNEARLRRLAAEHGTDRPRMYSAFAPDGRLGAVALLREQGYQPVRYFFDMVRPSLDELVVPDLPEGIEIRPVAGREHMRKLFDADVEAFLDHWGGFDATDQAFEQWLADPDYDPALFVVAWESDDVAGAVVNVINEAENEALGRKRGLLDSVFVRRQWRGRGLAYALVMHSLRLLRDRGQTSAWLGVDAENPNGALRLYEKAGFAVDTRAAAYRKPMETDR